MAIEHELSSEIAAALLTVKQKDPGKLKDLKETVIKVHAMLQQLTAESRLSRTLTKSVKQKRAPG